MAWVTPKTNWRNGDYYNAEDVDRISGNLSYIKSLASQIYPEDPVLLLAFNSASGNSKYCTWLNLEISNINIYGVNDYLTGEGEYTLTYFDTKNIYALYKLKLLYTIYHASNDMVPYVQTSQKIYIDNSQEYYTGCGYYLGNGSSGFFDNDHASESGKYWGSPYGIGDAYKIRLPFNFSHFTSDPVYEVRGSNFAAVLANQRFWTYQELNAIESDILTLYNNFSGVSS